MRAACSAAGSLFIVNDHLDVALLAGAGGVHLGAGAPSLEAARRVAGPDLLIGASASTLPAARAALAAGADYLGAGPAFPTPLKPAKPVLGAAGVAAIARAMPAPGLYYRVYGKYAGRGETQFSDGRSGANDWRMTQGGMRLDWDGATGSRLTLQGDIYDGHIGQPTAADIRTSGGNALVRWTRTFSNESELTVQGYYDRTYRRIPGTFAEDLESHDVELQHRLASGGRHDWIWGLGYRFIDDQQHNDYPLLAFLPAHVRREWFNVFAQDEITLPDDRWHLTLGAKLEHNDYTGFEFQPSVRVAWLVSRNQTAWAAISRAVRTPSRIDGEFFSPRDPPFSTLQGNPNFDSEKLVAWELGYRVQPQPQLSLSLALFHHDYDRLRSIERVNPATPLPLFLGNLQEGSSEGVELTADYHATAAWRLRAGFTWMDLDLRNKTGSTAAPATHTDAEAQFSFRSMLDLPGDFEWDVTYRHVARIVSQDVPAYGEIDTRLGWAPAPGWDVSIVGQNLLHDRHAEFNPRASRQLIARGVYLRITCRH